MKENFYNMQEIISYREGNRLEAKRAKGGIPNSMWETYSSFANTDGGIILLGVDEKKDGSFEVTGVQNVDQMLQDFWNMVNNRQKVNVNLLVKKDVTVEDYDGKRVITIRVPRADRYLRPVFVGQDPMSGSYRRNGEGDYHCSHEEVSAMYRDAYQLTQDHKLLKHRDMKVFCMDTVHSYRNIFNISHINHVWSKLNDEEFLGKIGAIGYDAKEGKFYPTSAGLLMFGYEYEILSEYPQYFLDYQDHRDPNRRWVDRLISSSGDWSGNIFDFFFAIANKLSHDLPRPFRLEGMMRVDDTPLHKAVREALLNTLVNADYYGRRGVVVKKYPDGYIFENPGAFRIGVKEAMSGGISDPRNAILFKMFALIELGERAGSGIPTIIDGWKSAYGELPTWENTHNPDRSILRLHCRNLSVVLFKKASNHAVENEIGYHTNNDNTAINSKIREESAIYSGSGDNLPCKSAINNRTGDNTSDKIQMILDYIEKNGEVKTSDIMAEIGLKASQSRYYLSKLVKQGDIKACGSNKNRTYKSK